MMKALIIGASGLVGSHLLKTCQIRNWSVIGTYNSFSVPGLTFLDMVDKSSVQDLFYKLSPDVVFLPAFCSHVDYCELNPNETYQINVVGIQNIVDTILDTHTKLVFYSSDYVFDGKNGPYKETDTPNPICVYGLQKLEIEQYIQQILSDYLILRITVVYGYEAQGKNFVHRLIRSIQNGKELQVPHDQIGTPTLVDDIAEVSCRLVEGNISGLFHVSGPTRIDRFRFALKVAENFDLPTHHISSVSTKSLNQAAPRPLLAGMVSERLGNVLNWEMRPVQEGLTYLRNHYYS